MRVRGVIVIDARQSLIRIVSTDTGKLSCHLPAQGFPNTDDPSHLSADYASSAWTTISTSRLSLADGRSLMGVSPQCASLIDKASQVSILPAVLPHRRFVLAMEHDSHSRTRIPYELEPGPGVRYRRSCMNAWCLRSHRCDLLFLRVFAMTARLRIDFSIFVSFLGAFQLARLVH